MRDRRDGIVHLVAGQAHRPARIGQPEAQLAGGLVVRRQHETGERRRQPAQTVVCPGRCVIGTLEPDRDAVGCQPGQFGQGRHAHIPSGVAPVVQALRIHLEPLAFEFGTRLAPMRRQFGQHLARLVGQRLERLREHFELVARHRHRVERALRSPADHAIRVGVTGMPGRLGRRHRGRRQGSDHVGILGQAAPDQRDELRRHGRELGQILQARHQRVDIIGRQVSGAERNHITDPDLEEFARPWPVRRSRQLVQMRHRQRDEIVEPADTRALGRLGAGRERIAQAARLQSGLVGQLRVDQRIEQGNGRLVEPVQQQDGLFGNVGHGLRNR